MFKITQTADEFASSVCFFKYDWEVYVTFPPNMC